MDSMRVVNKAAGSYRTGMIRVLNESGGPNGENPGCGTGVSPRGGGKAGFRRFRRVYPRTPLCPIAG
jgi:hypothetical protein